MGQNIVVGGLVVQILFFGFFVIVALIFHSRMLKSRALSSAQAPWQKYLYTLYAASILILIRSIFRIAEFVGGNDGAIMKSEAYVYIFDGLLMLGVMVLFNVVNPGEITSGTSGASGSAEYAETGQSEVFAMGGSGRDDPKVSAFPSVFRR
jgi:hypothetical protein